jgi:hypothetical protein
MTYNNSNVISMIPAMIKRDDDTIQHKLLLLECALRCVEDLDEIRIHLIAQLDDLGNDLEKRGLIS